MPLFILWFGIGDVTSIVSVLLACLLPVIVSTYHGVQSVPAVIVWSARAMGTPHHLILWRILLPSSLLNLYRSAHRARVLFVLTISVEMIAAKTGIGKLIFLYGESGAYAYMSGGYWRSWSSSPVSSCSSASQRLISTRALATSS